MSAATASQGSVLEAGTRLGTKYRLERRVAVGGMGEVWRAKNLSTGADVAVKVLRGRTDVATCERLRGEARLGATLSHRGIVRIFDLLEEPDGSLVLVMELLRGESLARALERRGTFPVREAVAVVVPVLSALAHAHQMGIVHRDVTPANVFLSIDPDGHVTPKLVDFGIAKIPAAGSQTLPGSVLGTPRYMSPEQIRATETLDGRSDVFSVAAVAYEMMTGASPFEAPTPSASLALVLESPVDPDSRIDPRVWVELARALAKRPYERHAGAKELASALCAAVGEDEGSLAALLQRDPPSREELDAAEADEPGRERVTSVEGQSLEGFRPRARTGWVIAGAAAASVALIVGGALRRPTAAAGTPDARPALAPTVLPSPAPIPAAAPSASTMAFSPAAPAAPVASSEPPKRTPRAPPPGPRVGPRSPSPAPPVATTPGF